MRTRFPIGRAALVACTLALTVGACTDLGEPLAPTGPEFAKVNASPGKTNAFSVYTQNLWLGGETGPLFSIDLGNLLEVIPAVNTFWGEVLASDIPGRAAEVVNEIESRQPDIVALQEAVGYVLGNLNLVNGSFTPTAPGPDLLAAVMAEIGARGLPYTIAAMQPTTGIALPSGFPDATFTAPALAVQDRVVMLKRNDITATETASGLYDERIDLGPVDFVRGWVRVTVERDGVPHHFVGTHLETQGTRSVNEAQGLELIALADALDGVTVLMGDFNSDAAADPSAPSYTDTYGNLMAAGFTDAWAQGPHGAKDAGLTCCQEDTPEVRELHQRIDFVLVRPALPGGNNGNHRGWFRTEVLGTSEADRTPSGLWPSDHAGVASWLKLPAGSP
jgi:endonuclease/exonuclease/phosphatase family metal-dependent hydrolase